MHVYNLLPYTNIQLFWNIACSLNLNKKNKIFLTDLATVRTGVIFFGVLKGFSDMKGFSDLKGFLYQSQYLKGNMKTIFERGLGNGFVVNRDQERSFKAFLILDCHQWAWQHWLMKSHILSPVACIDTLTVPVPTWKAWSNWMTHSRTHGATLVLWIGLTQIEVLQRRNIWQEWSKGKIWAIDGWKIFFSGNSCLRQFLVDFYHTRISW